MTYFLASFCKNLVVFPRCTWLHSFPGRWKSWVIRTPKHSCGAAGWALAILHCIPQPSMLVHYGTSNKSRVAVINRTGLGWIKNLCCFSWPMSCIHFVSSTHDRSCGWVCGTSAEGSTRGHRSNYYSRSKPVQKGDMSNILLPWKDSLLPWIDDQPDQSDVSNHKHFFLILVGSS